ncbi:MAG TPA: VOC family protein [Casimicrobiaceae bacterium]|nr:VOC family protein [Casimicrobiaceae bacterium]
MVRTALDHLVVGAATLEQGEDYVEAKLGVRPSRGGKHAMMGTYNSVLRLGDRIYLEVIAVDPEAKGPGRPRWFELDRPAMQELLGASPRLIHWVARCDDIDAARRVYPVDPGPVRAASRGALHWRITIPDDGHLPGGGVLPTLIQWADARHPTEAMADERIRLTALAATHPTPGLIRAALAALGLSDVLRVSYDRAPRLAAMLSTPRGPITL